jgi:hypothetical protein
MVRRVVLAVLLLASPTLADDRIAVSLPAELREPFRMEMRGHMESLDDVLAALAAQDFQAAADIAELRMDFGHRFNEMLLEGGLSPDQVRAMRERRIAQGWEPGQGGGAGGGGFGRYLPDDFRAMGMTMHEAARGFAASARAIEGEPDGAAYAALLADLQFVTTTCRSCHASFRLE